ncbi:MAG: hypothetical protein M5U19_03040 [Microthrixaceae bacterium]|nr:hypothetical protein [Microthrixaceae bacterium]
MITGSLGGRTHIGAWAWPVLVVWAVLAPTVAATTFRWEEQ